jgi:hypothetical protein
MNASLPINSLGRIHPNTPGSLRRRHIRTLLSRSNTRRRCDVGGELNGSHRVGFPLAATNSLQACAASSLTALVGRPSLRRQPR